MRVCWGVLLVKLMYQQCAWGSWGLKRCLVLLVGPVAAGLVSGLAGIFI